jgi:hypothetical protein
VEIAQEVLHSVKKNNLKETILKLDLSKAYDRVNWTFLRLVLIQMGMSIKTMNWIMGCLQSESFIVLINISPSIFFRASRGLAPRLPTFPLLISPHSRSSKKNDKRSLFQWSIARYKGIKSERVSHLLFVDDVLCSMYDPIQMCQTSKESWIHIAKK